MVQNTTSCSDFYWEIFLYESATLSFLILNPISFFFCYIIYHFISPREYILIDKLINEHYLLKFDLIQLNFNGFKYFHMLIDQQHQQQSTAAATAALVVASLSLVFLCLVVLLADCVLFLATRPSGCSAASQQRYVAVADSRKSGSHDYLPQSSKFTKLER